MPQYFIRLWICTYTCVFSLHSPCIFRYVYVLLFFILFPLYQVGVSPPMSLLLCGIIEYTKQHILHAWTTTTRVLLCTIDVDLTAQIHQSHSVQSICVCLIIRKQNDTRNTYHGYYNFSSSSFIFANNVEKVQHSTYQLGVIVTKKTQHFV